MNVYCYYDASDSCVALVGIGGDLKIAAVVLTHHSSPCTVIWPSRITQCLIAGLPLLICLFCVMQPPTSVRRSAIERLQSTACVRLMSGSFAAARRNDVARRTAPRHEERNGDEEDAVSQVKGSGAGNISAPSTCPRSHRSSQSCLLASCVQPPTSWCRPSCGLFPSGWRHCVASQTDLVFGRQ